MPVRQYTAGDKQLRLTDNFVVGDFWANPTLQVIKLDDGLAKIWEKLFKHFGIRPRLRNRYNGASKPYQAEPSAGFRVQAGGGASGSQHLYGRATDVEVPGVPAVKIAQYCETLPEVGGIGLYYSKGQLNVCEHIHIDTRGNRARWGWNGSYSSGGRLPGFGGIPCVFKNGSQSCGVEMIQLWLRKQGYDISADGEYGPKTIAALKDWQGKNGLKADGMYGKDTNQKAGVFDW